MPTLNWIGKEKIISHHLNVPFRVLNQEYVYSEGKGDKGKISDNKIIHGDNLEGLKSLLPEYEGKIKCIYIDPPYNTGNEGWMYNDNSNHPKIKRWLHQIVGKEGEDLSRHDKWLCMMYPRLKLLHKLLAEDGAIFVSIDDNEHCNLKLLMDEIFGLQNFVTNIIWQKKYSPQNDAKYFSDMHDFIVVYAKKKNSGKENSGWVRNLIQRTEQQNNRYRNPDNDPRGPWKAADFSVKTYSAAYDYEVTTPSGRKVSPPSGRAWATSNEQFMKWQSDNRIWFGKNGSNVPSVKIFLSEVQDGTVPLTLWLRDEVGDNQEGKQELKKIFSTDQFPFDTPKPVRLISRVLQIATRKDDIILDSFAGSGTTAHAVLNLNKEDGGNRKFILIEMEDYAEAITAERTKRVIEGYGKCEGTGGDFAYYTLGDNLFDVNGYFSTQVPEDIIRSYMFYTETGEKQDKKSSKLDQHLLGVKDEVAYYFCFNPSSPTILNYDFLASIKVKANQYVIYADNCVLNELELKKYNIIFKKIPRDVTKF